ncbi:SPOR domain-containing protein [Novosphingobium colocasiae]
MLLSLQLASAADATRARETTAASLGTAPVNPPATARPAAVAVAGPTSVPVTTTPSPRPAAIAKGPSGAGADFTRPTVHAGLPPAATPKPAPAPAPAKVPAPAKAVVKPPVVAATPARAPSPAGAWRVQLGAFGVAGNAQALWSKIGGRPELAGHPRLLVPAGKLTKLQAGGFASEADASAACRKLTAGGFTCIPTRE